MEEVKLLGFWSSPFVYRVKWALKHKDVKYEYLEEDLWNKKSDLLLRSNPVQKRVPVLLHDGKPIAESIVILEYIEEMWPHNPLLPQDPHERAMARYWMKFGEDKAPILLGFYLNFGEEQEKNVKEAKELLKILEKHGLGENKFFGGDEIGLVDFAFGWIACWLEVMEEAVGVKLSEAESLPRLHEWIENFKKVPLIKENTPDRDRMLSFYKQRREQRRESFISSRAS